MKKIFIVLISLILTSCSGNSKDENEESVKVSSNKIKSINSTAPVTNKSPKGDPVSNTNKIKAKPAKKEDIQKQSDLNNDSVIDGNDWRKLSKQQKQELVSFYTTLTYDSLGITPSKDIKSKEISKMILKLNSYYSGSKSGKSLNNGDMRVYDVMLAAK